MKNVIKFLQFLIRLSPQLRYARPVLGFVLVTSILAGLTNTGLLVVINSVVENLGDTAPDTAGKFLALCVSLLFLNSVPRVLLADLTQRTLARWRISTCQRIVSSPLRHLENLGPDRLLASVTGDVDTITTALSSIPGIFMQLIFVLGCMIYLIWLSPVLFVGLVIFLFAVIFVEELPLKKGRPLQKRARELLDTTFGQLRAITAGAKELKMHAKRRRAFLKEELSATTWNLLGYNLRWRAYFIASNSVNQILGYILFGALLFVVPRIFTVDSTLLIRYIITTIYFVGPLGRLIQAFQGLSNSSVALEKMQTLGLSLDEEPAEPDAGIESRQSAWQQLELASVSHSYHREGEEETFTLGPIDLSFEPGELVFIVGGNGSGKTTLAKLILGLYMPESGEIRLDGEAVQVDTLDRYRQHFSAVFTDFYVFEKLLGLENPDLESQTNMYLRELQLEHKVEVEDGNLSTLELSQGQRKRLALLTAYLEDREIYLFDEWAADQDPVFKHVFYHELLRDLKARGKTLLVISHDDHYYHVADRIIKLSDGRVDSEPTGAAPPGATMDTKTQASDQPPG